MSNPRLSGYPALDSNSSIYRTTPDEIHDYEYQLHNAVERLNNGPG